MNEEFTPTPVGEPHSQPPQPKENPDIANEIREMGVQFEAMFRAAMENDRAKQLRRDLAGGMQELTSQLQTALKSLQSSPIAQQAEERGRQLVEQAQQSTFVQDLQETVVSGVAQLNERLRQFVTQLEQQSAAPSTASTTQQVPIETEPATSIDAPTPTLDAVTGETRRLDDEVL